MSNLGNFWRTDKSWVSKSIRILPGIRFWGQKSSQTMLRVWKWRFTQVWYFPLYPPLVNQPPRARGVEDLQRPFLCVKPSSYMYRQTYQKQGLILESYRILGWTNVTWHYIEDTWHDIGHTWHHGGTWLRPRVNRHSQTAKHRHFHKLSYRIMNRSVLTDFSVCERQKHSCDFCALLSAGTQVYLNLMCIMAPLIKVPFGCHTLPHPAAACHYCSLL